MNKNSFYNIFFIAIICFLLIRCLSNDKTKLEKVKKELLQLKNKEAKIEVKIGDESFYKPESKFIGGANIDDKGLKISLKDQFNGNVIISMEEENWYSKKPYRVNFKNGYPAGDKSGSFLIGKISDIVNNVGEGYILFNGFFEIKYIDKNAFYLEVEGDLKSPFGDAPLKKIAGSILWNKPDFGSTKVDFKSLEIPLN